MMESLAAVEWRQAWWLLLALQPLILWIALRWLKNRHQQRYADEALLPWVRVPDNQTIMQRVFSRNSAYFLSFLGLAITLAGPRLPNSNNPDLAHKDIDVMLLMDLSRSMQVKDTKPSRIRRAVLEAFEFLSLAKNARVGVTVYAARPHLLAPVTSDLSALEFYLRDLDTIELPTQGGDAVAAMRFVQKELKRNQQTSNNKKSIVWFTDGDFEDSQTTAVEEAVIESDIKTYILGFGVDEDAAIPLKGGKWLEQNGSSVFSRADFNRLDKMAKKWGGVFSAVSNDESDWNTLYQNGILKQIKPEANAASDQWKELFHWFLWPALILLMFALYPSKTLLLTLIVATLMLLTSTKTFAEESYLDTLLDGASIYQNEDYEQARSEFIQAVLSAETDEQRATALHNLGNTLFKTGDYENAFYLFSDAIRYNNAQTDSIFNQKLTYELFKLLKQRQQRMFLFPRPIANPDQTRDPLDLPETMAFLRQDKVHTMDFSLPKMPEEDLNRLLDKGLERITLLEADRQKSEAEKLLQIQINDARLYLNGLEEQKQPSSNALWKRLFEIEEGFPADVDSPETVPGIRPW